MSSLSRRGFLKLAGATVFSAGLAPFERAHAQPPLAVGRAQATVRVYDQPGHDSTWISTLYLDDLVPIFARVRGLSQRKHNPYWYRTDTGYVHSSFVQWTEPREHPVLESLPPQGFLGEIAVPFVDARRRSFESASAVYRLYYGSVYRVTGIEEDEAKTPWYRLLDDRLGIHYFVPASRVRPIPVTELAPISPNVADKRIEVNLTEQTLVAYEASRAVFRTRISSGEVTVPGDPSTRKYKTPVGEFRVERKKPSRHMGYGEYSVESDYELPGVPWVSYFHWTGVAFHGTYWHSDYGVPRSQGCINLTPPQARWIYRWCQPVIQPGEYFVSGEGTPVTVVR